MQEAEHPQGTSPVAAGWEVRNEHFKRLLARARAGDSEAFEQLYEDSARWLLSVVRRLVGDDSAEDVLADTYIQIWRTLKDYDETRGPPTVWMAVIARSRALDHLRRERAKNPGAHVDGPPPEASHDETPEQLLTRSQEAQMVRLSVASLDAIERLVVGLAYFRDCACPEIAQLTGLPLATVKSSMTRAQQKLRVQFTAATLSRSATTSASWRTA